MTKKDYMRCLYLLKSELIPAMGCTEPVALAYAAAVAGETLGARPASVKVEASGSIIKNVKSVIVPNTGGLKGIPAAAAAGIVSGDARAGLQVLASITPDEIGAIAAYLKEAAFTVEPLNEGHIFDIRVTVEGAGHTALVRIADRHTNIVRIERDGRILRDKETASSGEDGESSDFLSLDLIRDFVEAPLADEVKGLLKKQIDCNMAIAREGLSRHWGANIGTTILRTFGDSVETRAMASAAAGSDARMNGCEMPVVINSGSGNQGITCTVPVIVYAEDMGADEETTLRALLLADLMTLHIKSGVGRLSAYCGAVCAGAGAGAGIGYLKSRDYEIIENGVANALAITSGIICDGAKSSCAGKIASSVNAGILGYHMAEQGNNFRDGEGIVKGSVEGTIHNVGRLASDGMLETNDEIIRMMTETC